MQEPTFREHIDELAYQAGWDDRALLDLALEFLEDYDLPERFLDFLAHLAQGPAGEPMTTEGDRCMGTEGQRAARGCPDADDSCCGWGTIITTAGPQVATCSACGRFWDTPTALAHILACFYCFNLAAVFRRSWEPPTDHHASRPGTVSPSSK